MKYPEVKYISENMGGSHLELVRIKEVLKTLSISKSTLYLKIKNDEFPAPLKVGQRISAWKRDDLALYIDKLERSTYQLNKVRSDQGNNE